MTACPNYNVRRCDYAMSAQRRLRPFVLGLRDFAIRDMPTESAYCGGTTRRGP